MIDEKRRCPFCRCKVEKHIRLCYDGAYSVCITVKDAKIRAGKLASKAQKDWQWAHNQAAKVGAPHE